MLSGKKICLMISGGIAAYKIPQLIRDLRSQGADIRCLLSSAAAQFVTPLTLASLSENPVLSDMFDNESGTPMDHIRLSREADLLLLAPASASRLAKMACGIADDMLSACVLASDKPILVAPAMNWRMWQHPATQRNCKRLKQDGVVFVGPIKGEMACGEYGMGRMADIETIIAACKEIIGEKPLAGRRALVTAGPTREPIDPVRYLSNGSSGKQGVEIAESLLQAGAQVTLVSGPMTAAIRSSTLTHMPVQTALQMHEAVMASLPADIVVMTAAVSDWRVAQTHDSKIKKQSDQPAPQLDLIENPDILAELSSLKEGKRPNLVIGFAAETELSESKMREKQRKKGCDWLLFNDVSPKSGIIGGDENEVRLLTSESLESWPRMSKSAVARKLVSRMVDFLQ